ncbi:hypothetical protein DL96DRAFT_1773829 [Flagelloscypha sp. PMI_526]|nr:hypothetical protein DL96DRAFT_1773829 [Flagelloscypha sp. PMI_526]
MLPFLVAAAILAPILWWVFRRRQIRAVDKGDLPHRPSPPSPAIPASVPNTPHGKDVNSRHNQAAHPRSLRTLSSLPASTCLSPAIPSRKKVDPALVQIPLPQDLCCRESGPSGCSEQNSQLESAKNNSLVFLSIDGGQWETLNPLSQIEILGNILFSYEFDNDLEEHSVRLSDVFDLVLATGTGALIACMLIVLEMTTDQATSAYLRFYETAFPPGPRTTAQKAGDIRRALQALLDTRAKVSDPHLSDTKMRDIEKKCGKCKFGITAIPAHDASGTVLFRAYRGRNPSPGCTLLEALLATLTNAELLPAFTRTQGDVEEQYISASIGRCNPTGDALIEAGAIFAHHTIASIVSIGAGRPRPNAIIEPDSFIEAALNHSKDCQSISDDMKRRFSRHSNLYVRFEVNALDLVANQSASEIIAHSRAYLNTSQIQDQLGDVIYSLSHRPERLKVSLLSGLEGGAIERVTEELVVLRHDVLNFTHKSADRDKDEMAVAHLPSKLTVVARLPIRSLLELPCFLYNGSLKLDVTLLISQGILSSKGNENERRIFQAMGWDQYPGI